MLEYRSRTVGQPSRSCIRTPQYWDQFAVSASVAITDTMLADADAADLYLPEDFIPVGTLVALATGGAYSGKWVPYLPNIAAANGENTALGMVFEPMYITRDQRGVVEQDTVVCSILPAGTPVQVFASKMPQYNDHTAYAGGAGSSAVVTTADLPTGFVNLDDFAITGLAGL